jgi:hypothetical protein
VRGRVVFRVFFGVLLGFCGVYITRSWVYGVAMDTQGGRQGVGLAGWDGLDLLGAGQARFRSSAHIWDVCFNMIMVFGEDSVCLGVSLSQLGHSVCAPSYPRVVICRAAWPVYNQQDILSGLRHLVMKLGVG